MSHHFSRASLVAANNSCNRLRVLDAFPVIPNPICRLLFAGPAKFTHEHNTLCILIMLEDFQCINEIRTSNHISTHTDTQTLTQTRTRQRSHSFVRQSARLCDDADVAGLEREEGLESDSAASDC
jgi:hypothetical protein